MDENSILNYINKDENISFSNYRKHSYNSLMFYLKNTYIDYRKTLNLDENYTFGMKIELENMRKANKKILKGLINNDDTIKSKWEFKKDKSLNKGLIINSYITIDKEDRWNDLDSVLYYSRELSSIGKNAEGHVYVGAHLLGKHKEKWIRFIKLWVAYEDIIYRFCYGNYTCNRDNIFKDAAPLRKNLYNEILYMSKYKNMSLNEIIKIISTEPNGAFDLSNIKNLINNNKDYNKFKYKNTIQFNCPNGSLDPIIWQNNINLFCKLIKYSISDEYDEEFINDKITNMVENNIIRNYISVYLEDATELADLIYDNNLDKIYFLRQYIKDFSTSIEYERSKPFTKTYCK